MSVVKTRGAFAAKRRSEVAMVPPCPDQRPIWFPNKPWRQLVEIWDAIWLMPKNWGPQPCHNNF